MSSSDATQRKLIVGIVVVTLMALAIVIAWAGWRPRARPARHLYVAMSSP